MRGPKKKTSWAGQILFTDTLLHIFTYFLGARTPDYVPDATSGLRPPTPHVKYLPGGHPHLPQIIINIINIIAINPKQWLRNLFSVINKFIFQNPKFPLFTTVTTTGELHPLIN